MQHFKSFKQQGWTLWGFIFTASIFMFSAYVGMKLTPVYMNNNSLKNAMELALDNNNIRSATKTQLINTMKKQMFLDGIANMVDLKRKLSFKRSRKQALLSVKYSKEVPLLANVSLLIRFENEVEKEL